jgi:toxin ParE1/3/4
MSRVELAPEISNEFDRIFDHLAQYDLENASARIREIIHAFGVLETNPLIGRPAPGNRRELIIGRGSRGYVSLYRYVTEIDTVFILALRGQREAGYKES